MCSLFNRSYQHFDKYCSNHGKDISALLNFNIKRINGLSSVLSLSADMNLEKLVRGGAKKLLARS